MQKNGKLGFTNHKVVFAHFDRLTQHRQFARFRSRTTLDFYRIYL